MGLCLKDKVVRKLLAAFTKGVEEYSPEDGQYNAYTVLAVTNLAHEHARHPPQIVYQGDNDHYWSRPLADWPGSLIEETKP